MTDDRSCAQELIRVWLRFDGDKGLVVRRLGEVAADENVSLLRTEPIGFKKTHANREVRDEVARVVRHCRCRRR